MSKVTCQFERGIFGPVLDLLAGLTGRVWFWYSCADPECTRRHLYFDRIDKVHR